MSFVIDNLETSKVLLKNVRQNDIIFFGTDRIAEDYFVVYSNEFDNTIPALLLQIWKLSGGFDHSFFNLMENELNVNKQVEIFKPRIIQGEIIELLTYRSPNNELSDKEQFYFDMWPEEVNKVKNEEFSEIFEVMVRTTDREFIAHIPVWTPLQKIPVSQIKIGSILEIWMINDITTIMKVMKI